MTNKQSKSWSAGSIIAWILSALLIAILVGLTLRGLFMTKMMARGHMKGGGMMGGGMMMGSDPDSNQRGMECCDSMMERSGMMDHGMMRGRPAEGRSKDQTVSSDTTIQGDTTILGELDEAEWDWIETIRGNTVPEDARNRDTVEVKVGSDDRGLSFSSPVLRVDTGTTVRFRWTGRGGSHNVNFIDLGKTSSYASSREATYEITFDEPGTHRYVCDPHRAVGMKGIIVVGSE